MNALLRPMIGMAAFYSLQSCEHGRTVTLIVFLADSNRSDDNLSLINLPRDDTVSLCEAICGHNTTGNSFPRQCGLLFKR